MILSLLSAVYDPIGLVAPYTVKAQFLEIWRSRDQKWDDILPDNIVSKLTEWSSEQASRIETVIPRSLFQQISSVWNYKYLVTGRKTSSVPLLSWENKIVSEHGSSSELAFVCGKARVAPMKDLTIESSNSKLIYFLQNSNDIQTTLILEIENTRGPIVAWYTICCSLGKSNQFCRKPSRRNIGHYNWRVVPACRPGCVAGTRSKRVKQNSSRWTS